MPKRQHIKVVKHNYGSEGWGFEPLRARETREEFHDFSGFFFSHGFGLAPGFAFGNRKGSAKADFGLEREKFGLKIRKSSANPAPMDPKLIFDSTRSMFLLSRSRRSPMEFGCAARLLRLLKKFPI